MHLEELRMKVTFIKVRKINYKSNPHTSQLPLDYPIA